jgi:hypothetical protein
MRVSNMTHGRLPENRIVAEPPLAEPPFDPKEPLPVSRTRVCIGVLLLISGFAVGSSSSFFPAAKLWLGALGLCSSSPVSSFSVSIVYALDAGDIHETCMDANASSQTPERTADRREDLLVTTSTLKPNYSSLSSAVAQLVLVRPQNRINPETTMKSAHIMSSPVR